MAHVARRAVAAGVAACAARPAALFAPLCNVAPALTRPLHASAVAGGQGGVVLTHSTYAEGLVPFLQRLADVEGVERIVPGRLASARGHVEHFELVVKTATDRGWKCAARKGTQVQEVFVVTALSREGLEGAIEATHGDMEKKTTARTRVAQREAGQGLKSTV